MGFGEFFVMMEGDIQFLEDGDWLKEEGDEYFCDVDSWDVGAILAFFVLVKDGGIFCV